MNRPAARNGRPVRHDREAGALLTSTGVIRWLDRQLCVSAFGAGRQILTRLVPMMVLVVLLGATVSTARGAYITDQIPVTLRRGPGIEYRILKNLTSTARIEILEDGEPYVKVRTADGTEGYLLKQYVTTQQPHALVAESLQREQAVLRKKLDELTEQNNILKNAEAELQKVTGQYERLQKGAQNVTETMAERDRLRQETEANLQKIAALEKENHYLWRNNILRWFFAGAGVLCLGWLLGRRPSRRTRSF